ncbi:hypothetical protein CDV55_102845 [Aspergillus turcosus]|uniref:Aflatoxin regulatory protein domain-containing protein n=1 Tax=Aspergillus turcosus TaxID=1245748 RepID=A0A397HC79_9EURO|nr:hypothetical protein CDV55_102845 [Aspergillus turcosus]RLL96032.1 hypothetical protein CFD26_103170 [Aspergillus turcosus]
MGRPRSLHPKTKQNRRAMRENNDGHQDDQQHLHSSRQNGSVSAQTPDLNIPMIDPLHNPTTLGLPEIDYDDFDMDLGAFDSPGFSNLALNLQQGGNLSMSEMAAYSSRPQSTEEQNLQRLWRLQHTLMEKVHWVESQVAVHQNASPDVHPLRFGLPDAADTQSDHPIHQMMRCSQTFLEIIQSFVATYQESICSMQQQEPLSSSNASAGDDDEDDYEEDDDEEVPNSPVDGSKYHPQQTHSVQPQRSHWFALPTPEDQTVSPAPGTSTPGRRRKCGKPRSRSGSGKTTRPVEQDSALPPACQTQFPICLTIMTCHVLLIRLHRSVLTDLYTSVRSLVARYTPAGDLTGRLAVLDNFSGSAPFSNVHLDGSTLKLDGVLQITTVLQLSCDLLERTDKGVEILLTGAGHVLSAPGTYLSTLEALARQEARTGRGSAVDANRLDGGRAARLAPLRMLVKKIRRCLYETCL